ncbi:WD40-repeat-containing domain protein [Blakeslea trispora]|nr:WD40-repeat-containing domain protein [Blakeslea trispora]
MPNQQQSNLQEHTFVSLCIQASQNSEPVDYSLYQTMIPESSNQTSKQNGLENIEQLPHLVKSYENLPSHIQTNILLDLLGRSNKSTLQFVNSLIVPVLKCDFLVSLPYELKLQVIGYLDVRSLCTASRVSKIWQLVIEGDKNTWLRLLQQDGFDLPDPCSNLSAKQLKLHYRRQYILKMNWRKGRFKRIEFEGHKDHIVTCLQFDEDKIVSGATDAMINIYDTKDPTAPYAQLQGHAGGVWALQYLKNTLVSGSIDRTVRVWDIQKRKCTHIFKGHTSTVRCLQIVEPVMVNGRLQPSQPLIVTGSRDFSIRVWTLPDVEQVRHDDEPFVGEGTNPWFKFLLVGHSNPVRSIAAHGNTLVSGSYDNTVAVWDLEKGRMIHRMEGHTSNVYSVVIDPIRQQCMSGSMDTTVYVWSLVTGECLHKLDGHSNLVGLLGLTSRHLVSASADRTLRVWDAVTGVCEYVLAGNHGHEGAITCFKHDEEKAISGSEGGLKMWDINTGRHMYDLVNNVEGVWWVAFDKSRCVVAIRGREGTSFQLLDFSAYEPN